ncbi:cell division ATP-binding protein FtsE [Candidatus Woesebacteria bacterium RIFCSPHIGHO2_02_FULL_38_9]|uniref:Cell division ATP-binding protein FtsE n=2 Tax=Candidatus Roizmaniibacteriota TaxID=1752723 RepID=A0A1F7JRT2_9BACT|nr:MAG: cell division ATP-binding protein FtsE [Candidatus Roizmanbacteria bacterium RIFCSPLOWO2_01_FULL_41_22]OGK58335.1 MAG: cell division ATP-binding protein FtsE [Candidatus Roizmanbacteria bacterium RIFCSPLOWO2_02_FULL_41_9]OGM32115.1 MAG: cell division ATP-binding protein FtsE [Candidatus Woesebacteria bacterium RIFCSPHIGHO2_02_FULL_38_9]
MISFDQISLKFPLGNTALENISFDIKDNEFVYFVGPSGAGKTTILRLLLNEFRPSKGTIVVDSLEITAKKFKKTAELRRKIGVVFQDFKILHNKNVFENIALSLRVKNVSNSTIKQEVKRALQLVNLPHKEEVFPAQLSAGELQRVAIARAVVGDRKIILADEPTGNLDPQTTWEVMKIFRRLEKDRIILFATHNVDIVNSMQRRVIALKEGKIIKDQLKGEYEL